MGKIVFGRRAFLEFFDLRLPLLDQFLLFGRQLPLLLPGPSPEVRPSPLGRLDLLLVVVIGLDHALRNQGQLTAHGVVEDPGQGVVVLLGDGIELVVMTTGAGNRDGHEAASQSVDPVVQGLAPGLGHTVGIAAIGRIIGSQGEESGGHGVSDATHQITADLELDEAVVGQVVVEGGNDPIPVAPSLGQFLVPPIQKPAEPVTVPGHVQPMTSPTFPVADGAE